MLGKFSPEENIPENIYYGPVQEDTQEYSLFMVIVAKK